MCYRVIMSMCLSSRSVLLKPGPEGSPVLHILVCTLLYHIHFNSEKDVDFVKSGVLGVVKMKRHLKE